MNTSTLLLLLDLDRLKQIMHISALHVPKFSTNILKGKKNTHTHTKRTTTTTTTRKMGRGTSPANGHTRRQHHRETLLANVTQPRRGQRWCIDLGWGSQLRTIRSWFSLRDRNSKGAVTADLGSPKAAQHEKPSTGRGMSTTAASTALSEGNSKDSCNQAAGVLPGGPEVPADKRALLCYWVCSNA